MLTKEASSNELFKNVSECIKTLGLDTVEVTQSRDKGSTNMRVVLSKREGEINTDDLEKAYNVIYPMYQVLSQDRDLNLEVSSPGIQRTFKDICEFEVFKGKTVRVYSTLYSSYVVGKIEDSDKDGVTLSSYLIEDKKENGEIIRLNYDTISKAKLECIWEEKDD